MIYKNCSLYPFYEGQEVLTLDNRYGIIDREIFDFDIFHIFGIRREAFTLFQLKPYVNKRYYEDTYG